MNRNAKDDKSNHDQCVALGYAGRLLFKAPSAVKPLFCIITCPMIVMRSLSLIGQ